MPPHKQYSEKQICNTLEAIQNEMSPRKASETFGVPRMMLNDRVSGRVQGTKSGPARTFSDADEETLVKYLKYCAEIGYGKSKSLTLMLVGEIAQKRETPFINGTPSQIWWLSFLSRHPTLVCRKTEKFGKARTGIKFVPAICRGNHEKVTVLAYASASGGEIPPLFIFNKLHPEYKLGADPKSMFTEQKSGWMDAVIFERWLETHFLKHAPPVRPFLLIFDG